MGHVYLNNEHITTATKDYFNITISPLFIFSTNKSFVLLNVRQ